MHLHIEYLLSRHHCVVVSGLGAFLVNDTPARYDEDTHVFMPPVRMIGFTTEIAHNDGLLDQSISRREGVSLDEAGKIVAAEVAELRCLLSSGEVVGFGNLGEFRLGTENSLLFEPSSRALPVQRFAALPAVKVKPVGEDNEIHTQPVDAPKVVRVNTMLKAVASVLLLFVLGGLIYATSGLADARYIERAMIDSLVSDRLLHSKQPAVELSRDIVLNIALPPEEDGPVYTYNNMKTDADRYLLVVASLESASSARKHINGNADMHCVNMGGKYRVYVDSFPSFEAAAKALPSYLDRYENVWICER